MEATGYEECSFSNIISKHIPLDCLEGKRVALIAVPPDFDMSLLKKKILIENGTSTVHGNLIGDEGEAFNWNIHSETTVNKTSNVLCPCSDKLENKIAIPISLSVSISKSLQLPPIRYPRVSKKIHKLPKPQNLTVRWKPFGGGLPFTAFGDKADDGENSTKEFKQKIKKEIKCESETDTEVTHKNKKKDKKGNKHELSTIIKHRSQTSTEKDFNTTELVDDCGKKRKPNTRQNNDNEQIVKKKKKKKHQ